MIAAKSIAKWIIPERGRQFIRWCIDSEYRAAKERERFRKTTLVAYQLTGGRVLGGPFEGLVYVKSDLIGGACKLLGTYERELNGCVEQIIAKDCATIINIGAGEGYYSVGLAMRMPGARVICYELEGYHQDYIRRLAEANGVADRVEIHGYCDRASLAEALARAQEPVAIVCDVEGCEYDLLDPDSIPRLKDVHILVELHDMYRRGVSKTLKKRFAPTHAITRLHSTPRTRADFPSQLKSEVNLDVSALDEDRGGTMYWYWMESTSAPGRRKASSDIAHEQCL